MNYGAIAELNAFYKNKKEEEAINRILANAYESQQAAQPAQEAQPEVQFVDEQAAAFNLPQPEGLVEREAVPAREAVAARAGGINIQNALGEMAKAGMGTRAFALQQGMEDRNLKNRPEYTLGEIGAGNDQAQSVVFNKATGEYKSVGESRRKSSVPDWMIPGYLEAQKKLAEAKGEGRMSPTAQKELFESDETLQAASNVIGLLDKAKEINKTAKYGPYSKERAKVRSWLPGDNKEADATIDLDNIMTGQALESLKLIFGGMPTEGERKILLDLQASVDKTPAQRELILDRARELAQRRYTFNKSKADSLRSGKYFKESPDISPSKINGPEDKKYKLGETITKGGKQYIITKLNSDGNHDVMPVKK